ncbi:MAG: hypothetical protein AAFR74_09265, partial [Pseudomonadota bacterium]
MTLFKFWPLLMARAQVNDTPSESVPEEAATEGNLGAVEGVDDPEAELSADPVRPAEQVPETVIVERTQDPIEAITETTEKATEAATEFVGWVGSGELEALIALALVVGFTALQITARWLIMRSVKRVPRSDDYSLIAIAQRVVKRFHIYFMFAIALAVTD